MHLCLIKYLSLSLSLSCVKGSNVNAAQETWPQRHATYVDRIFLTRVENIQRLVCIYISKII